MGGSRPREQQAIGERSIVTGPGVRWTYHGTAVVSDYDAALAWLSRFCGCRALEYSDLHDPLIARRGGMTWVGDGSIELMEPNDPEGPPGRFLARFGAGFYGLALQVEDAGLAARWFSQHGVGAVGDPGRGFFFTRPRDTCGLHLEWAALEDTFDPRFGATVPQPAGKPLLDVQRLAHWGAWVEEPRTALARLREIWPAKVLLEELSAPPAEPAVALSLCDGILALYRLPRDSVEMEQLWGRQQLRPRMHLLAFRVSDLGRAAAVFERERVRILRGTPDQGPLVTHPGDTHGMLLAWTDRDLPGDPRGAPDL